MSIQGILLDIEGTTSSISFVYDEMFPYVRRELQCFLKREWHSEAVQDCLPQLAVDVELGPLEEWFGDANDDQKRKIVASAITDLMDADVKATGLKQLQGLIWKDGFHAGQLVAHLFDDVQPALKAWKNAGLDLRIYSSGSIAAQKLFFGHTIAGDLLSEFDGFYDTTTGPKKEAGSYTKIAADFGMPAEDVLFISDVDAELDAAVKAGMQTALCLRPGNMAVEDPTRFECIRSFDELSFSQAPT